MDYTYIHKVLPGKMRYNLKYLKRFSLINDIRLCIETVLAVYISLLVWEDDTYE